MDTTYASPNRTLAKTPSLLGIALSAVTGIWLLAVTTEVASAQTAPQSSHTVTYGDLDLSTADGARTLLRRIDLAAKRICGPEPVPSQLQPRLMAYYRDCISASTDTAVARVGAPALLAVHQKIQSPASAALAAR
jgi:UrcA family protein